MLLVYTVIAMGGDLLLRHSAACAVNRSFAAVPPELSHFQRLANFSIRLFLRVRLVSVIFIIVIKRDNLG